MTLKNASFFNLLKTFTRNFIIFSPPKINISLISANQLQLFFFSRSYQKKIFKKISTPEKSILFVHLRCWSKLISSSTNGSKSSLCSTMYWTTFSLKLIIKYFRKFNRVKNMYCNVLKCPITYRKVMYCSEMSCNVLRCPVMYCNVLLCTAMFCNVLKCPVMHWKVQKVLKWPVLNYNVL